MPIRPPVALIAGPTASGKSALAVALAQSSGGIVINADSAQIYADLPVLSAAPTTDERNRADHRLFGIRDGADPCSAAEWAKLAQAEIKEAHAKGRLPILVGGTGLYLRTLLDGIAPVPAIRPEVRDEVRGATAEDNHSRLGELDPGAAARINPNDSARIARALEVIVSTGRTLAAWQAEREGGIGDMITLRPLILLPPRDWLYARCDARFEAMMESGAIPEVGRLLARRLPAAAPVMRAIGVREIASFLAGESAREIALARGQQATRNYAKRQYTWFSRQPPPDWPRFTDPVDPDRIGDALALLQAKA